MRKSLLSDDYTGKYFLIKGEWIKIFFAPYCSKVASNKRNALEWTVANLFCAILHFGQDWSSFREQRVLQILALRDPMSLQLAKLQNLFVYVVRLHFCTFYLRCHLHTFQNIATVHIWTLFVKVLNCETRYPISLLLQGHYLVEKAFSKWAEFRW